MLPVIFLASFTFMLSNFLYLLNVASLWLAASGPVLVSCFVKAWRLQLLAVDHDPGTKLGPSVAHDLELSCDGQQLARARVCYVYCEFFSQVAPYIVLESILQTSPNPSCGSPIAGIAQHP